MPQPTIHIRTNFMNQKEKEKLCALINLANKGLPGYRTNYEFIVECLQEAELHFDYPNCYSFNQNRQVVVYTFSVENQDFYDTLCGERKALVALCKELIEDDYELSRNEDGEEDVVIKKVCQISKLPIAPKVTFEHCERVLIDNLEKAEHSIIASVAWFTNQQIMDVLKRKALEGVIVGIIVDAGDANDTKNKDFIRKQNGLPFPVWFALNMCQYYKNIVHHKFCIIDNKIVLHGTFNWTIKATYNDEDITEDKNPTTIDSFLKQFKSLRKKYNCFHNYS